MNEGKKNILRDKSFGFAIRIAKLFQFLQNEKREFVLSKQLMRSGTSIGDRVSELEHAESKADFVHKLAIAQKDCNESIYWIELLHATQYITKEQFENISNVAIEIIKLITSSIKTAKSNIRHESLITKH